MTLVQVFSCKFCEIFKNNFFTKNLQATASGLVKPFLNCDLYFISKTSGTALLETIVSYKPLPSLSQENRKTLPSAPRHNNITSLMCIFSVSCSYANLKKSIINKWKYRSKGLLKTFFCHQKVIKNQTSSLWNFLQPPI